MSYTITKQDSQESYGYKEIFCDTEADVATVPTNFLPGSSLLVREGPEVYFLIEDPITHIKTWKKPED